jgi:hypothetical protein
LFVDVFEQKLSLVDYTALDEEFDIEEEEDIAMVLALHTHNKGSKHGGSNVGHTKLCHHLVDVNLLC